MKNIRLTTLLPLLVVALTATARAAIVIPGANGSDGALNITVDTVIDLSQAVTGDWDTNNAANAGKGVYDWAKWAVVFKYTDVNIAAGATVTFKNHASRAPVVWLVSGNVTIAGAVSLDGQHFQPPPLLAEPGPGGFRGGAGRYAPGVDESAGFGPGGGASKAGDNWGAFGAGGSYGSSGSYGQPVYGNPSLIPLLGGSGGGGRNFGWGIYGKSGGAGGGAILIACTGTATMNGMLHANGGNGSTGGRGLESDYAGGSGGGVRVICDSFVGGGGVQCFGGDGALFGGVGRIRIERTSANAAGTFVVAPDPSIIDLPAGATALLWPPAGAPEVRIVSIGAGTVPADPRAEFGAIGADVALPLVNSTLVLVETTNVEEASQVKVRGTPRSNGNFTEVAAVKDSVVSSDPLVIRWVANLPVNAGYSAVQVKVVCP